MSDFSNAAIKSEWPGGFGARVPAELINARIVGIGSFVSQPTPPIPRLEQTKGQ
jgi:hypothetical protein